MIGGLTGSIIGLADGDDPVDYELKFTSGEKAVLGGIFFGGIGALVGLPVGAGVGSKDVYRINPSEEAAKSTPPKGDNHPRVRK